MQVYHENETNTPEYPIKAKLPSAKCQARAPHVKIEISSLQVHTLILKLKETLSQTLLYGPQHHPV